MGLTFWLGTQLTIYDFWSLLLYLYVAVGEAPGLRKRSAKFWQNPNSYHRQDSSAFILSLNRLGRSIAILFREPSLILQVASSSNSLVNRRSQVLPHMRGAPLPRAAALSPRMGIPCYSQPHGTKSCDSSICLPLPFICRRSRRLHVRNATPLWSRTK